MKEQKKQGCKERMKEMKGMTKAKHKAIVDSAIPLANPDRRLKQSPNKILTES